MTIQENNWKVTFDERFGGKKTYLFFAKRPDELISFIEQELTKSYNLGKCVGTAEESERWALLLTHARDVAYDEGYKKAQEDMKKAIEED